MARSRRTKIGVGFVLAVLVGLFFVGKMLLSSRWAVAQVEVHLSQLLGVPVHVGAVDIGFFDGSKLSRLAIHEAAGSDSSAPWLEIDAAEANFSLLDYFKSAAVTHVAVDGVAAELRFDADGKLLTRLPRPGGQPPAAMPEVAITRGRVTLAQAGRKPLVISGIAGDAAGADGRFALHTAIDDAYWGKWHADTDFDPSAERMSLHLVAANVAVNQERLSALPFVPASVWQQVHAEGMTPVDLTLTVLNREAGPEVSYRVALEPTDTRLHVASIDLHADQASGKVVIEDKRVRLDDVTGRSAGGQIRTTADLNFREKASSLHFLVGFRDLFLRQLPKTWSVPALDGQLSGQADLRLSVQDGQVRTGGGGEGTLTNARLPIPTLTALQPIYLELKADGTRYRIDARRSVLKTLLPILRPTH